MADHNVVSDRQGMYFLYPSVGLCSEGCMMAPFLHERVCLRPRLDNYGTCAQIFVCLCKSFESSGVRSTPRRVRPPPRGGGSLEKRDHPGGLASHGVVKLLHCNPPSTGIQVACVSYSKNCRWLLEKAGLARNRRTEHNCLCCWTLIFLSLQLLLIDGKNASYTFNYICRNVRCGANI